MTTELTPYQLVRQKYVFPPKIEDRDYQIAEIDRLAPLPRVGLYWEPCTGKTFAITAVHLYKKETQGNDVCIVVMPPILLDQWYAWTQEVKYADTGKPLSAVIYRGSPTKRRQLNITGVDFVLMSIQVFKKDFEYLYELFEHRKFTFAVDEATSIKNGGVDAEASGNYRRVRDFTAGKDLQLATGTPLSKPGDAYGYISLVSPTIYRNARHFELLHVEERDFFDKVTKWGQLEFLRDNMLQNGSRVYKRQAMPYLKKPLIVPVPYELEPDHYRLYKKLAEEQLLLLKDGGKIDATTPVKLYQALQQIICNPGHFSGDATIGSAAHDLLDQIIDELAVGDIENGQKLMVLANYKMTNRGLLQYLQPYGVVGFYSEVTAAKKAQNLHAFMNDKACRIASGNAKTVGYGLDGLHRVCSHMYAMECPIIPMDFTQAVDRLDRDGQMQHPFIRVGIAQRTCQVRLFHNLLNADALANQVQGGWEDLRDSIYGKE